jgi:hypothetical protein
MEGLLVPLDAPPSRKIYGQTAASSMHVFALHCVPPAHDPEFVQPISHVFCEHETLPPHEFAPLQHSVLALAALETAPEHEGEPLHAMLHCVVALHVTLPLHA